MEDRRILVFYLGVGNMHDSEIPKHIDNIRDRFFTPNFIKQNNCEIFIIPTREVDSRIECINPVYITDEKLIAEHESLMKEYNDSLYNITGDKY